MALATVSTALMRMTAAIVLILLVSPPLALAQDVSERPDGVICRQPECDIRKSSPPNFDFPYQAAEALVNRVKRMPVSALDRRLPRIPFERWLREVLEAYVPYIRENFGAWGLSYCDEPAAAFPTVGADLCVEIGVDLLEKKSVNVIVGVAAGSTSYGQTSWKEIAPVVRTIHIGRRDEKGDHDSLDVKTLSDLEAQARLPIEQWPAVDLKTTISYTPSRPSPGQVVRFTITISNSGPRDADRAHADIYIGIPDEAQNMKEIRRDWFPRVPSGKTVSVDISATLGRGDATIIVNTTPHGVGLYARERNDTDNDAIAEIPYIP